MVSVKLYVEGAGQTDFERTQCREAFSTFFAAADRLAKKRPRTIPCGGRQAAYKLFVCALKSSGQDELPLLLVDSEGPVSPGHTVWQHLKARDGWDRPEGAGDTDAFLMVQVMETWFVADKEMLKNYFGPDFNEKHLLKWQNLEAVPKLTVYEVLEKATATCKKKSYAKGKISFEMLAKLDPKKVENACPHAKKLFDRLRKPSRMRKR
jgi:hypothetical protein